MTVISYHSLGICFMDAKQPGGMVWVQVGQNQVVQGFDSQLLKPVQNLCSCSGMARIDQDRMLVNDIKWLQPR